MMRCDSFWSHETAPDKVADPSCASGTAAGDDDITKSIATINDSTIAASHYRISALRGS
jgi:hypothetical protein